jgi:cytidylate kinase
MAAVVTLSASYGTGGSVIGPRVAERLGLPFLDRAIPVAVAEALAVPLSEAMARDERRTSGIGRALAGLARAASAPDTAFGTAPSASRAMVGDQPDQAFQFHTEQVIHQIATTTGGVILGRGAACILGDHPRMLHVRLDGPVDARVERATSHEGVDEATARKQLASTDRAREAYVRYFYKVDPADARLYHLVLDATAFEIDACVDLIVTAARDRGCLDPGVAGA